MTGMLHRGFRVCTKSKALERCISSGSALAYVYSFTILAAYTMEVAMSGCRIRFGNGQSHGVRFAPEESLSN